MSEIFRSLWLFILGSYFRKGSVRVLASFISRMFFFQIQVTCNHGLLVCVILLVKIRALDCGQGKALLRFIFWMDAALQVSVHDLCVQ